MNERSTQPLYVYDRICPRESKRKQILREYGTAPATEVRDRNPIREADRAELPAV